MCQDESREAFIAVNVSLGSTPEVSKHTMMGPCSAAGRISMRPVTRDGWSSSHPAGERHSIGKNPSGAEDTVELCNS